MTDTINEDFVGIHLDAGGSWSFIFPGEIERISEQINRFETVTHELFAVCEDFIRPTELEYSVQTFAEDGPIRAIHSRDNTATVDLVSVERKTIADENGLTADDIPFESYTHQSEDIYGIGDIEVTQAQTWLTLNDYEGWIDRTDDQHVKPARYDKVYDGRAKHDPIEIRFDYRATPKQSADTNSTFGINIKSPSDIWFEDTAIGQTNRRRLEAFFEQIIDRFNIVDTMVLSRNLIGCCGSSSRLICIPDTRIGGFFAIDYQSDEYTNEPRVARK